MEALDLPGHGRDKTPLREITLAAYTNRVREAIDAHAEPVILVGHSLGGIVITQVAEERPDKIQRLVYLTALLPRNGETARLFAQIESDSLLVPNLVVKREQGYQTFKEGAPLEDADRAISLLVPQPLAPGGTPVSITAERFGRVPRVYIECLLDRAIPQLFSKGCTRQRRVKPSCPCRPATRLSSQHPSSWSAISLP